jgi:hypothetical protein
MKTIKKFILNEIKIYYSRYMTMGSHSAKAEEFTFPLEETSAIQTSTGRLPFSETSSVMKLTLAMWVAAAMRQLTFPNCQDTMLNKPLKQEKVCFSWFQFSKRKVSKQ